MSIRNLPFSLGKITNVASRYASFPKEVVEENSVFATNPLNSLLGYPYTIRFFAPRSAVKFF